MRIGRVLTIGLVAFIGTVPLALAKDWSIIRIGTEGAYAPFNFKDADGNLQGFDVDIALAVCEKIKAQCTLVAQDWDGIIPALQAGKYDAIFASMAATDERKQVVDFSDKYYDVPSAFFAPKDSGITDTSPAGLAGKTIGAQSSTIQAAEVEEKYKDSDVKLYPSQEEVNLDLAAGRIDVMFVDKLVGMDWVDKTEDGKCCQHVGADVPSAAPVAAAVRKEDQDLKELINQGIKAILADGTYEKINAKYFPFSIY